MTEEEAKTKWCPFVRHADQGGSFNRGAWGGPDSERYDPLNLKHGDGTWACACIGSACMAWRWHVYPYVNEPKGGEGHCGLAGKP